MRAAEDEASVKAKGTARVGATLFFLFLSLSLSLQDLERTRGIVNPPSKAHARGLERMRAPAESPADRRPRSFRDAGVAKSVELTRGGAVEESDLGSGSHSHGSTSSAGGLDGEARARETSLGQQASLHLYLQVRLLRCLFRVSASAASIPSFWRLSGAGF